ncbi:MAG: hypothetical protein AAGD88_03420 [Bacteroidota bacterium]
MKDSNMRKNISLIISILVLTACKQQSAGPVVQAVYPSSEIVPENLLRIYVEFSHPMKTIGNIEKIKLIDNRGVEVKNVFFNNAYELWNPEQTQLTLILDPARVKTGLQAHNAFGRALQPKKKYTLRIDGLQNVKHESMQKPFEKVFIIDEADLQIPDTGKWQITLPKAGTTEAFVLDFPQMLDYNSLRQRLIITNSNHTLIDGQVSIGKSETEWRFSPTKPWQSKSYILHINTRLEDPSGNNINGLFDHAIGTLKYQKEGVIETIPFKIKD